MGPSARRGLLAVGSLALTLVTLEVAGRVLIAPPAPPPGMVLDADVGWALPPSDSLSWRKHRVRTNSLGMRGAEPTGAGLRVLSLGDSSVFGDGVEDSQTFSARLAASTGADVQNGGVPGYICAQSRTVLRRLRQRFDADVAVVYSMHSDAWIPEPGSEPHPPPELYAASGIGRLIGAARARLRSDGGQSAVSLDDYRQCLSDIAAAQAQRGGRTIFVLPIADVDFIAAAERPPHPADAAPGLDAFRDVMRTVADESDSALLDLPTLLPASGLTRRQALLDPVHPSPRGHEFIAERLAELVGG